MAMNLSGGYAAGSGADMLYKIVEQAAEREQERKRNALAQEELRQREADRAAQREYQTRSLARLEAGDKVAAEDRDEERARRKEVDAANAENQSESRFQGRLKLIPKGALLQGQDVPEFQKRAPSLIEAQTTTRTPGPLGLPGGIPNGTLRFIGTQADIEKDAARKEAEAAQARQFAQQKELVQLQGRNALAVAGVNHPNPAATTPQQQNEVADSIALIDQIEKDPALSKAVGPIDQYVGGVVDPAGVNRFRALHNQLVGKLSLAQAGKLKGQGQISDKERAMLANAATALSQGTSEADYKRELAKIRQQFERMQMGGGGPMPAHGASKVQEYDYVPGKGLVPRGGG